MRLLDCQNKVPVYLDPVPYVTEVVGIAFIALCNVVECGCYAALFVGRHRYNEKSAANFLLNKPGE